MYVEFVCTRTGCVKQSTMHFTLLHITWLAGTYLMRGGALAEFVYGMNFSGDTQPAHSRPLEHTYMRAGARDEMRSLAAASDSGAERGAP